MNNLSTLVDSVKIHKRKMILAAADEAKSAHAVPSSPTSVVDITRRGRNETSKISPSTSLKRSIRDGNSKRRVRFEEEVTVMSEVPSRSSLSEADFDLLWYSEGEYSLMTKATSFIAKMMSRNMTIASDDEELCTRGLESLSIQGQREREREVFDSIDSVLWEQYDQQSGRPHSTDDEDIARVYKESAAKSVAKAIELAKIDEEIAHRIATETDGDDVCTY